MIDHFYDGSPMFFDRAGTPITMQRWVELREDPENIIVEKTIVGRQEVSTVWLGLDHGFGVGPPLIFETMIFGVDLTPHVFSGRVELSHESDDFQQRYASEAEAREGHEKVVAEMRAKVER